MKKIGMLATMGLIGIIGFTLMPASAEAATAPQATTIFLPLVLNANSASEPVTQAEPTWLEAVNEYRAQAQLPPVTENQDWSEGAWLHSRYMVKNDVIAHTEDPNNAWYSEEGLAAARSSDLVVSYNIASDHDYALGSWMQAPFHAVGILDPALSQVGYGSYHESGGRLNMGAALDVIRGLGGIPSSVQFPIQWPADGATVPLSYYWGENPDPLTSCPGYTAPAGLPIILQIGAGELTPNVTAHSLKQGDTELEHCTLDETTYVNPNPDYQRLGRSTLNSRDAIVIIPREPLAPGATYTVSVTVNGQTITWSFTVSAAAASAQTIATVSQELDNSQFGTDWLIPTWTD